MLDTTSGGQALSESPNGNPSVLLVDEDRITTQRLKTGLEARGFAVSSVSTLAEAAETIAVCPPDFAILDQKLADGSGLEAISLLKSKRPDSQIIVLTGYGTIASAVAAMKLGATDYLVKPADPDTVIAALYSRRALNLEVADKPMSADRVRYEHIQRVFEACNHNVSETARRLSMHRRTLQRILGKRAPR